MGGCTERLEGEKNTLGKIKVYCDCKSLSLEAAGGGKGEPQIGASRHPGIYSTVWLEAPKPRDTIHQRAAAAGAEMKGFPGQSVMRLQLSPGQPPAVSNRRHGSSRR